MSPVEFVLDLKNKVSDKINKIKADVDKLPASIDALREKSDKLIVMRNAATSSREIRRLNADIKKTEKELMRLKNLPPKSFIQRLKDLGGSTIGKIGPMLAGYFTLTGAQQFGRDVIDVTGKFQKYGVVLANTFQDANKGEAAMKMIQDFANRTPYEVDELTSSYIKLVNRGMNPTESEMTKLGDFAASQGKGFDQLVEATLDAQTGEFERLKEFGITSSSSGDKVTFSFKGVSKTVKKTDKDIQNYLYSLGELEGVSGSMNLISGTLEGKLSNLAGASDGFKRSIGEGLAPAIEWVVDRMKDFYEWATENRTLILVIVGVLAVFALAMIGVSVATWIAEKAQRGLLKAIIANNMAMYKSPYTWIIAAIIALVAVIIWLATCTEGWSETWSAVWEYVKLSFGRMGEWFKLKWLRIQDVFMLGFEAIKVGWYSLQSLWDKDAAQKGLESIKSDRDKRAAEITKQQDVVDEYTKKQRELDVWQVKMKADDGKKGTLEKLIDNTTDDDKEDDKNKTTTDAVATGGTRNTTVNITINDGLVKTVNVNGSTGESISEIERNFAEALYRVLGMAEQSAGA
jgi:hypothetical protein